MVKYQIRNLQDNNISEMDSKSLGSGRLTDHTGAYFDSMDAGLEALGRLAAKYKGESSKENGFTLVEVFSPVTPPAKLIKRAKWVEPVVQNWVEFYDV